MRLWIPFPGGAFRMRLWIPFPGGEHFACGCGFSFLEGTFRMRLWIPFPGEHFACGCGFPFPGTFRMRLWIPFPGGAFRMRQVRGGEAFIVAKAIVPSSRSSPPGHAAVLRCGMCYFSDGAMDSTVLSVVRCADFYSLWTKCGLLGRPVSVVSWDLFCL